MVGIRGAWKAYLNPATQTMDLAKVLLILPHGKHVNFFFLFISILELMFLPVQIKRTYVWVGIPKRVS